MASKTFLHAKYAREHADVAQHYGAEDELLLRSHYETYGRAELRGVDVADQMRVEGVLCADSGFVLISGWADRRHLKRLEITIDMGYERHAFGTVEPAWYRRPDVATVTGDVERPSGFFLLLELDAPTLHPDVTVIVNGKAVFKSGAMRYQATATFLTQALAAVAAVADQPFGQSMPAAAALHAPFLAVWRTYLDRLRFVEAFANAQQVPVQRSIVITLYRRADMLLPQLESLAPRLLGQATEIIVVANDLVGSEALVERLRGFCQIWDLPLRLFVCGGNSGFSRGNNFGAEVARGSTLILMNPDIFLPEDPAQEARAVRFLLEDPGNALHGALLYYAEGAIMHAGMYAVMETAFDAQQALPVRAGRVEHFGKGLAHRIEDDAASARAALRGLRSDVMIVSAALWKIDRDLFLGAGGLPLDYLFAYYEDADFGLRLLARGVPVVLDTEARFLHLEGAGASFGPAQRSFLWLNRYLFSTRFAASPFVVDGRDDLALL